VLESSLAALMLLTISLMVLMLPFLTLLVDRAPRIAGTLFAQQFTYILKLPPTKNWRPILAVELSKLTKRG